MLQLKNLTKTFLAGTPDEKKALDDVNLTLAPGDFVTVLGSNGAGKTTLFNAIAGTFQPDSGEILLDGQEISKLPDYKRSKFIGRMFQDPLKGTAPNMTIEENLALAYLRASRRTSPFSRISEKDRKDFRERLARLELGLEDRRWNELLQPAFVGLMDEEDVQDGDFMRCTQDAEFKARGGCRIKLHAGPGMIRRKGTQENTPRFILDLDVYMQGQIQTAHLTGALQTVHLNADNLFRNAITDELHDAMEPR